MKKLLLLVVLGLFVNYGFSQNTTVTDSSTYIAKSSAILDVQSSTKGFLVPRMTTAQRAAISSPAEGLLVYDSDLSNFYFYTSGQWTVISGTKYFHTNGDSVYITGDDMRLGVGTKSPLGRMVVVGSSTAPTDEPLFEVKNSAGKSIFAVYEDEVKVNFVETTKGNKGGFAVGGLAPGKTDPTEYLRITPDSVRVYIKDAVPKGVKGGFAVGGLSPGKTLSDNYLTVERDSTRIYVDKSTKGNKGGFAIGGLSPGKAVGINFLNLTPDNYFIGDSAGMNNDLGLYNSFIGQQAGLNNIGGNENIYIGYKSGLTSTSGNWNTFLGFESGYTNTGSDNTFIGYKAGHSHTFHGGNVYIGSKAGENATNGEQNVLIGESSGSNITDANKDIFIGFQSGYNTSYGSQNVFIGDSAGHSNTSGRLNTFVGTSAGHNSQTVDYNTFVGYKAGYSNTEGFNTAIGYNAGGMGEAGTNQAFFGYSAGYSSTGFDNTYIGAEAGYYSDAGTENVFLGTISGREAKGNKNVFLGYQTGAYSQNASGCVFIGYGVGQSVTVSDRLLIGNPVSPNLIYGEFDNSFVKVNGTFNADDYKTISLKSGEEINRVETGTANLLPIAYGTVKADASVASGSGNFSVVWNSTNKNYEISIAGESYSYDTYATSVTPIGDPRIISTDSVSNKLVVNIYNPDGTKDTDGTLFSFVIYKN